MKKIIRETAAGIDGTSDLALHACEAATDAVMPFFQQLLVLHGIDASDERADDLAAEFTDQVFSFAKTGPGSWDQALPELLKV